jgi:hypothetical protein
MTVTNLQSLASDSSDPFSAWQSDRVDNKSSKLAVDYLVRVQLAMANTAAANDRAIYVYVVPWIYDGSNWEVGANFGTTTRPTGSEGTASISEPNSMRAMSTPYNATQQPVDFWFRIGQACGYMPHGWSLALRNCTGAALSTGCKVGYSPVFYDDV